MHEITVAGTTITTLLRKLPLMPITPSPPFHARLKLSRLNEVGRSHMRLRLTWSKLLSAVISSMYIGRMKNAASAIISA
jgi:hypothetical protein